MKSLVIELEKEGKRKERERKGRMIAKNKRRYLNLYDKIEGHSVF